MTHAELFDAAIPALRREAQRLEPSGLRCGEVIAIVSGANLPEPLVLMQPGDDAIAMLRRHSDGRHADLFAELDRLAQDFPELTRVVLTGDAFGWRVATIEWSALH